MRNITEALTGMRHDSTSMRHPLISRRTAVQAGCVGLLGLGMNHLPALRAATGSETGKGDASRGKAKSCIYIFLSGGLSQHESFDMKPDAPDDVRGEFRPIATRTPGLQICEHLPRLAERSQHWAVLRSLTHPTNDHTLGHYLMLTGRSAVVALTAEAIRYDDGLVYRRAPRGLAVPVWDFRRDRQEIEDPPFAPARRMQGLQTGKRTRL